MSFSANISIGRVKAGGFMLHKNALAKLSLGPVNIILGLNSGVSLTGKVTRLKNQAQGYCTCRNLYTTSMGAVSQPLPLRLGDFLQFDVVNGNIIILSVTRLKSPSKPSPLQQAAAPPPHPVVLPPRLPTLLNPVYTQWIKLFPVGHHYIRVEAAFWQRIFAGAGQTALWNLIFGGQPGLRITRNRLLNFKYATDEQKCAEILIWGYPRNQRGIPGKALLQVNKIAKQAPVAANWNNYFTSLNILGGLGISTITKFAYFYSHVFNGMNSLILDARLIHNTSLWQQTNVPGLAYNNAQTNYLNYLDTMRKAAGAIGCTPEQLELFLFLCGDIF